MFNELEITDDSLLGSGRVADVVRCVLNLWEQSECEQAEQNTTSGTWSQKNGKPKD